MRDQNFKKKRQEKEQPNNDKHKRTHKNLRQGGGSRAGKEGGRGGTDERGSKTSKAGILLPC